ncbi:hypothetical protein EGT65_01195 [Burkholderia mallei]|uniref:Uncharacterized protein n=1 Tax=Burkholderia mallei TaxID=13373 RepID=A0AAX1XGC8_BURML|nr:hypothetical protein EGT70_09685 [Burkholderia mallei]RPA46827.1 hypothetical protein EGT65_01195 [Burkholderia mallei]
MRKSSILDVDHKAARIREPRAHRFLRKLAFYRPGRPRLYIRAKNAILLFNRNNAPCCK